MPATPQSQRQHNMRMFRATPALQSLKDILGGLRCELDFLARRESSLMELVASVAAIGSIADHFPVQTTAAYGGDGRN